MKAAALAKRTLKEETDTYEAIDNPAESVTTAWEGDGANAKATLVAKVATEEGKIADKWDAYKAWLDDEYEAWAKKETKEFEERWSKADTDEGVSKAVTDANTVL